MIKVTEHKVKTLTKERKNRDSNIIIKGQSLLVVYFALKTIELFRFCDEVLLLKKLYAIMKFINKTPVLCWIFFFIKIIFAALNPIYDCCYQIEIDHNMMLTGITNGDYRKEVQKLEISQNVISLQVFSNKNQKCASDSKSSQNTIEMPQENVKEIISKKKIYIKELESQINFLNEGIEHFRDEKKESLELEKLN